MSGEHRREDLPRINTIINEAKELRESFLQRLANRGEWSEVYLRHLEESVRQLQELELTMLRWREW